MNGETKTGVRRLKCDWRGSRRPQKLKKKKKKKYNILGSEPFREE
jgi:hypothetical protein